MKLKSNRRIKISIVIMSIILCINTFYFNFVSVSYTSGNSMLPTIKPDTIIYFVPISMSENLTNQIVIYKVPPLWDIESEFIGHRVIYDDGFNVICQGDNNEDIDPPITKNDIIGKSILITKIPIHIIYSIFTLILLSVILITNVKFK